MENGGKMLLKGIIVVVLFILGIIYSVYLAFIAKPNQVLTLILKREND